MKRRLVRFIGSTWEIKNRGIRYIWTRGTKLSPPFGASGGVGERLEALVGPWMHWWAFGAISESPENAVIIRLECIGANLLWRIRLPSRCFCDHRLQSMRKRMSLEALLPPTGYETTRPEILMGTMS